MSQESKTTLERLARDLERIFRAKLATQKKVASDLGLVQSTVSKAKRGVLKRETADTAALQRYANSLLLSRDLSPGIRNAAEGFLIAGGSEAELIEAIALSTRLVRRRPAA